MKRLLKENSLTLVLFFLFFTTFLVGQSMAGQREYNSEQREHGETAVSYWEYVRTPHFGEATFENWESEFLQIFAYVLLTAWFVQKGSAESKSLGGGDPQDKDPRREVKPDSPWPVKYGGLPLKLYEHSLTIAFAAAFLGATLLHAATGVAEYNSEQQQHGEQPIGMWAYLTTSRFWFESFQNWQSEFLAVAAIVVATIYLRERGSPESKPVSAPHAMTGSS